MMQNPVTGLSIAALGLTLLSSGCREAEDAASAAAEHAGSAGERVAEAAEEGGKQALKLATKVGKSVADKAEEDGGGAELSAAALGWIERGAEAVEGSVASMIVDGPALVPVSMEVVKTLRDAVDSDTTVEPIFRPLGDEEAKAKTNAAIGDMPRVEVIEGLTVGFRDLSGFDGGHHKSDKAYLVVWRQQSHRVGFVYRSKRDVDLEHLVDAAPRLVGLMGAALQ